jgi:ankyrin repeat protein
MCRGVPTYPFFAICFKFGKMAEWLFEEPRYPYEEDDEPIFNLTMSGNVDTLRALLQTNKALTKMERLCDGASPLTLAARENHVEIVRLLLDEGCDVNHANDTSGWTVMHYSICLSNETIVRMLLKRDACLHMKTNEGRTA